jgi:hypothetical protein
MFVTEFNSKLTSESLNQELGKVYNWSLNLSEMSTPHAHSVLSDMKTKLKGIKESSKGHFAEKNPQYMEALLVSRVLESLIDERFHSEAEERKRMKAVQMSERELSKGEKSKREKYVKSMKKPEVMKGFKNRYKKDAADVMWGTATNMAKKKSVEEAMDVLRSVLAGNISRLNEGEFDVAKAVMAARDMVDTMQDIVEKMSKMMNEDLPALSDVMRGELGQDQADAFVQAATSAIQPMLDQAKQARQSLDTAARGAAGEQVGGSPMVPPAGGAAPAGPAPAAGTGLEVPPVGGDEEDMSSSDVATGGDAPLGRSKRI